MVALSTLYTRIEAPTVTPHPFGLFSVAPPAGPGDTGWQTGVSWDSWACIDPNTTTDNCINGGTAAVKEFELCPNHVTYKPITVYIGIKRTGQSYDVGEAQASSVLEDSAEFAIERYLWTQLGAAVTEATALQPIAALANVEQLLGAGYMGTGVVHMSRGMAIRLAPQLVRSGDRIETVIGTPVAVGAGYGPDAIYGTGALIVARGSLEVVSAWNTSINDELVLAERTFVVGWDCYATGALVTPAT